MKLLQIRATLIILLSFGITFNLFAQNNAKITGIVRDNKTQETIPRATVFLIDKNTMAHVKATQTDLNGAFVMDALPNGVYTFKVSFVGYQTVVKRDIAITPASGNFNFGNIDMITAPGNILNEVTITAKKATIQNGPDKKVFSVNQSLVSEGGSASDLLQNVPTLQVDVNGNVSLRGSTGVKVLVDGKPSLIAGGDVTQVLQAIPASSIDKIEIINNPSAKYDAEGQSGIINIVLKKNTKQGFNGSAALTGGTRDNYNGSTSLSYQTSKINLYGNYSYRYGNTISNGFQNITYLNAADPTVFSNETFPSTTLVKGHNAKAGIDYSIAEKSVLSFSGGFNSYDIHRNEFLGIDNLNASHLPVQLSHRDNTTNGNGNSYDLSLDFDQKFNKPKEELTFNFGYSHGTNNSFQVFDTDIYNINGRVVESSPDIVQNNNIGSSTNYNIQADYTLPVGKAGKIEAGYRSQIRLNKSHQSVYNFNNTSSSYDPDYSLTDFFNSNNQVHALYFDYQNQIKNFSYQIGLRGEDANLNAASKGYDANNALYSTPIKITNKGLYPSVFLTQKFEGDQQLQLSYTRRVTRPTAREVNPFLDVSDPVNYDTGNPKLLPESVHSIELGYSKSWEKISLTSSLYFHQINNVIKHVESDPVDGIITTTPQNIKRATNSGLELIGHFDLLKAWDFTANVNVYERQNDAAPQFGISATNGFSWNANITNNINVVKNISVQLRADYRAADLLVQDRNRGAFGMDAGAKYDFPNKRASLSFSSRDIFNGRKWSFLRESDATLLDFLRRTQSSRASLTFTYRFGKGTFSPKKQKKASEQQDKRIDESAG
ncbi:MAG: TonB-dependent receptor [Mucilaginibacter sp.]|nr:TonB-dependent receptor [Mucilaginibacter sp.]